MVVLDLSHPEILGEQGLVGDGHPPMGSRPASRPEIVGQGVGDQGVREAISTRLVVDLRDQRGRFRLVEEVQQLVLGNSGGRGEHLKLEVSADHRGQRKDAHGSGSQAIDTGGDDLPDALGQAHVRQRAADVEASLAVTDGVGLEQVAQQLGDEKRVALRLVAQGGGEFRPFVVEPLGEGGLQEVEHTGLVEPRQGHLDDSWLASHRGQRLGQRMRRPDLIPVGDEDEQPEWVRRADEMTEQLQALGVRPMEVLEHDHHRGVDRGLGQPADDRRE